MATRKERALKQPIYLLKMKNITNPHKREFVVVGTTGNKYNVIIDHNPHCDCPDVQNICKHIYFIMLKIMKKSGNVKQSYTDKQLEQMFNSMPTFISQNVAYNKAAQTTFSTIVQSSINSKKIVKQCLNDSCPICLDDIPIANKNVIFCKYGCGKSVHKQCFSIWTKNSDKNICLFCMCDWTTGIYVKYDSDSDLDTDSDSDLDSDLDDAFVCDLDSDLDDAFVCDLDSDLDSDLDDAFVCDLDNDKDYLKVLKKLSICGQCDRIIFDADVESNITEYGFCKKCANQSCVGCCDRAGLYDQCDDYVVKYDIDLDEFIEDFNINHNDTKIVMCECCDEPMHVYLKYNDDKHDIHYKLFHNKKQHSNIKVSQQYTIKKLQQMCIDKKLPKYGTKDVLLKRLKL